MLGRAGIAAGPASGARVSAASFSTSMTGLAPDEPGHGGLVAEEANVLEDGQDLGTADLLDDAHDLPLLGRERVGRRGGSTSSLSSAR